MKTKVKYSKSKKKWKLLKQYRTIEQMCSDAHSITLKKCCLSFLISCDKGEKGGILITINDSSSCGLH